MSWQPIDTAPTDGTRVLVYWPEYASDGDDFENEWSEDCSVFVAYFSGHTDAGVFDECGMGPLDDKEIRHGHWRFASTTLDEKHTDPFEIDFQGGMYLSGEGCPTHWMPLPPAPDAAD